MHKIAYLAQILSHGIRNHTGLLGLENQNEACNHIRQHGMRPKTFQQAACMGRNGRMYLKNSVLQRRLLVGFRGIICKTAGSYHMSNAH